MGGDRGEEKWERNGRGWGGKEEKRMVEEKGSEREGEWEGKGEGVRGRGMR